MCAANQDANAAAAVKVAVEIDNLIGVLSEVDSHRVRIAMFFSTCFLPFPSFHPVYP